MAASTPTDAPTALPALLDALGDGVVLVRDGFVVHANPAAMATLGFRSEQELFWRPVEGLIHPSEQQRLAGLLGEVDAAPGRRHELRMMRRTGESIAVGLRLVTVLFEGAAAIAMVMRETGERRRLERQLQLSDRMASVGTLAAGMAHEINNPLTYVLANLEAMGELAQVLPDDAQRAELLQLLHETQDGASRVRTIVADLRTFARKSDERDVREIDLEPLIDSVLRMAHSHIRNRATLVRERGPTPKVRTNQGQLHQVLLNLVVNAAQAITEGSIEDNEVRVATSTDARGHVLIEISDTGAGIPPQALERIFDPFYTSKQGSGVGLGLWITHSIVDSLGGAIAVDSIVGRGTTFRITLPGV